MLMISDLIWYFQDLATSIWTAKGFFQNLEEIPGSVAAAREMAKMEG